MIHNIPQPDFEQFVNKALDGDPNVEIRKGVAFVSCHQVRTLQCPQSNLRSPLQDGETVTSNLEIRDSGHRFSVRSRHVIGCDGARSQVRKYLGIGSEGEDGCK